MKHHSHFNSALTILEQYQGTQPFHVFLKEFFRSNKKYGSKDRKRIAHLCYSFFRLGKARMDMPDGDRLLYGLFLMTQEKDPLLEERFPLLNEAIDSTTDEKLDMLKAELKWDDIFPFAADCSDEVDIQKFTRALLIQPKLFLRIRPNAKQRVLTALEAGSIPYELIGDAALALDNATRIDDVLALNTDVVVQDFNSQRVGQLLNKIPATDELKVWDCCAASGGKSIMAYDWNRNISLTVSDVRETILINLRKRFTEAGIKNYTSLVLDLTRGKTSEVAKDFNLIIADVPCSGSGTWGRTPDELYYFDPNEIERYSTLQKKIVSAVIPHLLEGGYLLYITCSIFRKENEENCDFIQNDLGLTEIQRSIFLGYELRADTLFAALFQKQTVL